jgi:hypothetical protein
VVVEAQSFAVAVVDELPRNGGSPAILRFCIHSETPAPHRFPAGQTFPEFRGVKAGRS